MSAHSRWLGSVLVTALLALPSVAAGQAATEGGEVTEQEAQQKLALLESVFSHVHKRWQASEPDSDESGELAEGSIALQMTKDIGLARELVEKGDYGEANKVMNRVLKQVNSAARLQSEAARQAKLYRQRYDELLESLHSYRWPGDVQDSPEYQHVAMRMQQLLQQAQSLADAGDMAGAYPLLLQAFQVMVTAQAEQRQTNTVVYALTFSGPEDEFNYELRRNQNYELLLQMTLEQKEFAERQSQLIFQYVEQAAQIRVAAQVTAGRGEFEEAIVTMEKGNAVLERALRMAGLPLP